MTASALLKRVPVAALSMMRNPAPLRASRLAAARPAGPAPTTSTER